MGLFCVLFTGLLCVALAEGQGGFEDDEWGDMVNCSENKYVVGFQLRVDFRDPLQEDNTGLNGIWFACGDGNESDDDQGRNFEWITSATSPYGQFQRRLFCGKGTQAVGFQLKVQTDLVEEKGGRDDDQVGAVNLNMICGDGEQVEGYEEKAGYEYLDAEYLEAMRCPGEEVVCGLQTKVGEFKWNGDNSGLKDVRIRCCSKNVK